MFVRNLGNVGAEAEEEEMDKGVVNPVPQYLGIKTCVVDRIFEVRERERERREKTWKKGRNGHVQHSINRRIIERSV